MPPTIEPYEIIPLLNTAWGGYFGRPISNKKSIADRGWNPLNRNILLDSTLRSTIAKTEKDTESTRTLVPSSILALTPSTLTAPANYTTASDPVVSTALVIYTTASTPVSSTAMVPFNIPRFDLTFLTLPPSESREKMNYSQGTAALCLDSIVCHEDLMNAREGLSVRKMKGKRL